MTDYSNHAVQFKIKTIKMLDIFFVHFCLRICRLKSYLTMVLQYLLENARHLTMHSSVSDILQAYTSVNQWFWIKCYWWVIWGNIEVRDFSLLYVVCKKKISFAFLFISSNPQPPHCLFFQSLIFFPFLISWTKPFSLFTGGFTLSAWNKWWLYFHEILIWHRFFFCIKAWRMGLISAALIF